MRYLCTQCRFHQQHHGIERRCVENRQLGKHFAIEFDVGFRQAIDEFAISQSSFAHRGVDADDPQMAHIAAAAAAIAEGVNAGAHQRFGRRAEQPVAAANEAFDFAEQALFRAVARYSSGSTHGSGRWSVVCNQFSAAKPLAA